MYLSDAIIISFDNSIILYDIWLHIARIMMFHRIFVAVSVSNKYKPFQILKEGFITLKSCFLQPTQ